MSFDQYFDDNYSWEYFQILYSFEIDLENFYLQVNNREMFICVIYKLLTSINSG